MFNNQIIHKKHVALFAIIGAIITVLYLVLNYTFVRFENPAKDETAVIVNSGVADDSKAMSFTLKSGSKTKLLKRGSYSISAQANNKETIYYKNFSGFIYSKQVIQTKEQLSSVVNELSTFECSHAGSQPATYYGCPDAKGSFEIASQDGQYQLIVSQLAEETFGHSHAGDVIVDHFDSGLAMKPYPNGYLVIANQDKLKIQYISSDGKQGDVVKLDGFDKQSLITDNSMDANPDSDMFAVFEKPTQTLWVFSDKNNPTPVKIPLAKEIGEINEAQTITLRVGKTKAFLAVTQDSGSIEVHDNDESSQDRFKAASKAADQQRLFIVDTVNKTVQSKNLEGSAIFSRFDANSNNQLVGIPLLSRERPVYINPDGELTPLSISSDSVIDSCWLNPKTIAYTSTNGKVFYYDLDTSASYLIYQNTEYPPISLSCTKNYLSFSTPTNEGSDVNSLYHIEIKDSPFTGGRRLESILPHPLTYNADSYNVTTRSGNIIITLDYDSDGNGPSGQELIQAEIERLLIDKGFDFKKIKPALKFNF